MHVGWPLKREKTRNRKSQETGESKESQEMDKIWHRGKSGNAKSQETGKVRKRKEISKTEQKWRFEFCMLQRMQDAPEMGTVRKQD